MCIYNPIHSKYPFAYKYTTLYTPLLSHLHLLATPPPLYNIGYEHIRHAPLILGPVLAVLGRTHSVVAVSPINTYRIYI